MPFILLENDNTDLFSVSQVSPLLLWLGAVLTPFCFLGVIPGTKPGDIVLKVMVFYLFDCGVTPASGQLLFHCVGLQIYKMINLGSNVIVYKLKHCVLHFEVNMMTF